jgi:hypothetical protein
MYVYVTVFVYVSWNCRVIISVTRYASTTVYEHPSSGSYDEETVYASVMYRARRVRSCALFATVKSGGRRPAIGMMGTNARDVESDERACEVGVVNSVRV